MKMLQALTAILVVSLLGISPYSRAHAEDSQYTTIDEPNAVCTQPGQGTSIYGINPRGDVVGFYTDAKQVMHGFVREGQSFSTIDPPGSQATGAQGIAPDGQIVGAYFDGTTYHGFLLNQGTYTTFDVPGSQLTLPFGINPQGDVAGFYLDTIGSGQHGFVRTANGSFTTFDVPAAAQGTVATGINAAGNVSGLYYDSNGIGHGFLRTWDGMIKTFDKPGAGAGTFGNAINSQDDITGGWIRSQTDFIVQGFLRTPDGKYTAFNDPSFRLDPNLGAGQLDQGTSPHGITPQGVIAGKYTDTNGCYHGFVRRPD